MQKKASNIPPTTSKSIRDSVNALKKTGSDSSLADIKPSDVPDEKTKNCNTLPMQSSSKNSETHKNTHISSYIFCKLPKAWFTLNLTLTVQGFPSESAGSNETANFVIH